MYSRGNTSEKERIASLRHVRNRTVVDLYAGIGYFTFAYLLAGASRVYACEINPFSIAGLQRGAIENGFTTRVISPPAPTDAEEQIMIFPCNNADCLVAFEGQADHVNLGLLPFARDGLILAVKAVRSTGGVLRLHEEVLVPAGDKETKAASRMAWAGVVSKIVQELVHSRTDWSGMARAVVEEVVKVKTLGKELEHLVADIRVEME